MTSETGVSERRRFPRVKDEAGLTWKRIQQDDFFHRGVEGVTKNISGGGLCFVTADPPRLGDMVALNVNLAEFGTRILALARVARCEPVVEGGTEVGVEFWWIGWDDDTAQKAIGDYIRGKLV